MLGLIAARPNSGCQEPPYGSNDGRLKDEEDQPTGQFAAADRGRVEHVALVTVFYQGNQEVGFEAAQAEPLSLAEQLLSDVHTQDRTVQMRDHELRELFRSGGWR